jgi:bud site selection protein 20
VLFGCSPPVTLAAGRALSSRRSRYPPIGTALPPALAVAAPPAAPAIHESGAARRRLASPLPLRGSRPAQDEIRDAADGAPKHKPVQLDMDLPGGGEFYCIECSKHFMDATILAGHTTSKDHKKRLKKLQEEQYTQAVADWAAGEWAA